MAQLDEATILLLREQWFPRLSEIKTDRRNIVKIMMLMLVFPIVSVFIVFAYEVIKDDINIKLISLLSIMLGLSAVAFIYIGRLQSCNDQIAIIEFYVYTGDRDKIIKSISIISCLGSMQGILKDTMSILKGNEE